MLRILLGLVLFFSFCTAYSVEASASSMSSFELSSEIPNDPVPSGDADNEKDGNEKEKDTFDFYLYVYSSRTLLSKNHLHYYPLMNYKPPYLDRSKRPPKA